MKEIILAFSLIMTYYICTLLNSIDLLNKLFIVYMLMMPYFVYVCNEDIYYKNKHYHL